MKFIPPHMNSLLPLLRLACSLARQDIHDRFAGSVLGGLWIFIWPVVQMGIYIIIFGQLMGGRLPGNSHVAAYGVYVAAGLIAWTCFCNTFLRCTRIFVEKKHIITKVALPLTVFPLSVCLSELLPFALSFLLLCLVDVFMGWAPQPATFLLLCLAIYTQQLLAMALGIFCGVIAVFIRDTVEFTAIIAQIWFWFTPIVYIPSILPPWMQKILLCNPLLPVVQTFHDAFLATNTAHWPHLVLIALLAHGFLYVVWTFFQKLRCDIRDTL